MSDRMHLISYRPDIDGLRAIAVLSVLLFHLGVSGVPGGFVGVDIFFVISGYLISGIIFNEISQNKFSIVKFYERRARRILPAFFFVSLVTCWAAYRFFFPSELVNFCQSLLAATFFVANIFFFTTLNYFSPAADRLPLLHYWSLGVEEQFYLLFPMFIIGIQKFAPKLRGRVIVVCLLASLLASGLLTQAHPTMTFYLLPFRAFELMTGSLLALRTTQAPQRDRLALAATAFGLCLLAGAIFMFRDRMDFPGFAAAVPCAGAAFVIWGGTGKRTFPTRVLGTLPMRAVGKISYSLYLIHWPVIVFGTQLLPDMHGDRRATLLFVISVCLAAFSFYLIEQPVRLKRFWTQKNVFASSLVAIVILSGISGDIISKQGYPARFNAQVSHVIEFLQYNPVGPFRAGVCFLNPNQGPADLNKTLCLPNTGNKQALLWGDSTAADLYSGLEPILKNSGYTLGQATASACPPVTGYDAPGRPFCKAFNNWMIKKVLLEKPNILILASDWPIEGNSLILFKSMLDKLRDAGIDTIVVGPPPFYIAPVPRIIADRLLAGNHSTESDGTTLPQIAPRDSVIKSITLAADLRYISMVATLCPAGNCQMVSDGGSPLEFDVVHFTEDGSKFVASQIAPLIFKPVSGAPD